MKRLWGAVTVGLLAVATAQGHFAFILPESDGSAVKVVFSDDLSPDTGVNIEKLANTKMFARTADGKDSPLDWKKGEGFYAANLPGSGPRTVYGITEYGVLQKGDSKPFRLTYYPKALVGNVPAKQATIGEPLRVEIVPAGSAGKLRFHVLSAGKPAAGVEVSVLVPEVGKKAVKTDADGFTPAFEPTGRYGVFARVNEAKGGEFAGKKYEETRSYATLVLDVGK